MTQTKLNKGRYQMNPFNEIKALQQKYKGNETATEALRAGLALSTDYVKQLVVSIKAKTKETLAAKQATRNNTIVSLKATLQEIHKIFLIAQNHPEKTEKDLEEILATKHCLKKHLEDIESLVSELI